MASPPPSPPSKKPKMSTNSDSEPEPELKPRSETTTVAISKTPRYKRRKVAIFIAYCGFGYQGMQKNPGARTIESDLELALFLSGAVPESDKHCPNRYEWARSARTDKGVSAAGQVVSGRFYVDPPGFVERMNSHLNDQIRVFGYKRVTNSFSSKKFCDRRRYVYLLPVFALDRNAHQDRETVMASVGSENELAKCGECSERGRKVVGVVGRKARGEKVEERSKIDECAVAKVERSEIDEFMFSEVEERKDLDGGIEVGNGIGLNPCESRASVEEESNDLGGKVEVGSAVKARGSSVEENVEVDASRLKPCESRVLKKEERCEVEVGMDGEMEVGNGDGKVEENTEIDNVGAEPSESTVLIKKGDGVVEGRKFEYGDEVKERFNGILNRYVGTHNFHNFTTRIKAEDPSAKRYVISFSADRVVSLEGIEFVRCEVIGQSFMLHQIRKMIGFAVAIMRGCCSESLMEIALRPDVNITVPTAPEVGLYLDECFFTSYNQKWKDSHEAVSMEAYAEQAEEFKLTHIFPHIASMEHKEGAVALWLHSLNHRNYTDFLYQETNGGPVIAKDVKLTTWGINFILKTL